MSQRAAVQFAASITAAELGDGGQRWVQEAARVVKRLLENLRRDAGWKLWKKWALGLVIGVLDVVIQDDEAPRGGEG